MTSQIKKMVSKNKRRYQEDGFDLDLSYICPNMIAMGFPAEKIEGLYRNHIGEVVRFLETRHKDRYKVYNLCSDRSYSSNKFCDRVGNYPFEDHHPPNLELMQPFCSDVHHWLAAHPQNVVAVHCKAGKGRTGVMICAYLLYTGKYKSAKEALEFYGNQRTIDMNGVTIPSQRRYVEYFAHKLVTQCVYRKVPMLLRSIHFELIPTFEKNANCFVYFVVYNGGKKVYKSPVYEPIKHSKTLMMPFPDRIMVAGDVRIDFYHKPGRLQKREKMFHFWFNTFFVCFGASGVRKPVSPKKSDPCASMSLPLNGETTKRRNYSDRSQHQYIEPNSSDDGVYLPCTSLSHSARERVASGSTHEILAPQLDPGHHVLSIPQEELDRACKDKHYKNFPKGFAVHLVTRCATEEDVRTQMAMCRLNSSDTDSGSSSPSNSVNERGFLPPDHPSTIIVPQPWASCPPHSCPLHALPSPRRYSNRPLPPVAVSVDDHDPVDLQDTGAEVHWASDSDDESDTEQDRDTNKHVTHLPNSISAHHTLNSEQHKQIEPPSASNTMVAHAPWHLRRGSMPS